MAPAASLAAVHGPAVVAPLPAGSLRASSDRISVSTVTASPRGRLSQSKTSFLPSQRTVLRSSASISGRANGFNVFFASKSTSTPAAGRTSIRCDATVAEKESPVEKYEYQAEVSRLMDLIVNSLYSHKEVFLRELVSNASDALDKLRFLSVTDPKLMEPNPNMEIRIKADKDAGTITLIDSGIGMTREELVDSLGTIAQSGTAKFMKAMKENKENSSDNLIGQFGVGFYSAFLVAQRVVVSTKSAKSDKQYVWEAEADSGSYTIREETDPERMVPRGTVITLYLKEDEKFEYADPIRIENLVKNYSQFISFPIYTWQEKTREVEVEDTESEEVTEEDKPKEKQMKKISEKYSDWELVNETKPIWLRNSKDVSKEDYSTFYKSTFKEFIDPQAYIHFSTEGEIEFKSLLYIPGMAPFNSEDMVSGKTKNIRLYVKRVFISDEFDGELFPRYLGFVKGVVDSNDLPLNVSREILQESRIVRIMKKRLVRKTFDMIEEIANREKKEDYKQFWTSFGKNLKLGCVEDTANHKRLAPLLRFNSSKKEEELISLDEYVEGMKEDQKEIYYLAADSLKSAKSAPFLEELVKRDMEVLLLVEPIDEVAISNLQSYKDKKFADISKEDLDLGDVDEEKEKETEKEYRALCDWMKQNLGDKVAKVAVSKRISSSPCVLVSGKFGWSANMERIMKAQTLGDNSQMEFMRGRRILEINPNHPIIQDLNVACKDTPRNPRAQAMVNLLHETALLSSGFTPENPAEFGARVYEMMGLALIGKNESEGKVESAEQKLPTDEATSSESPSEVVEASEVIAENDPWQS
ncbi:heat shock protein 90-5, chloroplastic [Physcomitrium patens]|uniref:Histidine kinase/HSP90-like ATPase domain-containing protein n=1 Tax=Physcomitrium patens TaxID=3218 RepID=A0A2K1JRQ9_PHYPA|nr:heat shock protein 90-5, chloroplastic-like [Physcomitrium patens]PNR44217.1 hypothetical protein PHYPA_016601 [Physcomitrium patens]|eukprot:XP_024391591.1 heat shock protein 90-5, chloroplastic-like [Physcomitrella patens]